MKLAYVVTPIIVIITLAGCVSDAQIKDQRETQYKAKQKYFATTGVTADQIANCSNYVAESSLERRKFWAGLTDTSLSQMPMALCRNIVHGITSGKLTERDINSFSHPPLTHNTAKVLKGG
jgi:hypothetical protein